MFKRFSIVLFIFVFIVVVPAAAADDYVFDDRSFDVLYSSRSVGTDPGCYNGTFSYISSGNSFSFVFDGETICLYFVRYRNSGSAYIYIDGVLVDQPSFTPSSDYVVQSKSYTDLGSGQHSCSVVCRNVNVTDAISGSSTSGRIYFDRYSVSEFYDYNTIISTCLMVLAFTVVIGVSTNILDLIRRFLTI